MQAYKKSLYCFDNVNRAFLLFLDERQSTFEKELGEQNAGLIKLGNLFDFKFRDWSLKW